MSALPPPMVLEGDSPRARLSDPVTSHEAADETQETVALARSIVLKVLQDHPEGLNDFELTKLCVVLEVPNIDWDTWRRRRSDLAGPDFGLVIATTEKRPGRTGRGQVVWKAVK